MSTRLETLAARLDAPLLVTDLTNIRYLTGFDSTNAALYVEPGGGATLYTDFRYLEAARDVPEVEAQAVRRALIADVGERLAGRVQFEADVLPYLEWERLAAGGAELVPTAGIVAALRAVKTADEIAKIGQAAADRRPRPRGADRRDVGRPQRARARLAPA